jgi:hypothetical protein
MEILFLFLFQTGHVDDNRRKGSPPFTTMGWADFLFNKWSSQTLGMQDLTALLVIHY